MRHPALPVLLCAGLAGCVWNIDKPPPDGWTYYAGNGATQREIEKAYLECGFPVPGDFRDFPRELLKIIGFDEIGKQYAALAAQHYCMKNSGFPTGNSYEPCLPRKLTTGELVYPRYPVCQPGAVIPVRSVENRLNSPYCKLYPKVRLCQPDYDPSTDRTDRSSATHAKPVSVPSYQSTDRITSNVQQDSNQQMNRLLNR